MYIYVYMCVYVCMFILLSFFIFVENHDESPSLSPSPPSASFCAGTTKRLPLSVRRVYKTSQSLSATSTLCILIIRNPDC